MARTKKWSSLQFAKHVARLADEKLAEKIVLMDVGQAIQIADYFVVAEGKNKRHLTTIAESIGATHLLVIGPNKETIYPEMLPAHWTKVGPSRLE